MDSGNSRFGVRGSEKLGRDLKAIFQLETEFHVDSNDSAFAQRDSFVGLSSKAWGTVKLGRMDTPFKTFGDDLSFLGVSSGNFTSTSNVLRKTGFGTSSASSFHLRRANVVQYETPELRRLRRRGAVLHRRDGHFLAPPARMVGRARVAARRPQGLASPTRSTGISSAARSNVPTSMSNTNDQTVNSKDKAWQAMLQYKWGKHSFEADYIQKKYDENATVTGRFSSYKNNAYEVIWDARWTNAWRTMVEYIKSEKGSCSRVNAACVTDGLDGDQINFGFAYYFSKRTYLFAMGALLKNGSSARYNNLNLQAPSVGEDIDTYAIGLIALVLRGHGYDGARRVPGSKAEFDGRLRAPVFFPGPAEGLAQQAFFLVTRGERSMKQGPKAIARPGRRTFHRAALATLLAPVLARAQRGANDSANRAIYMYQGADRDARVLAEAKKQGKVVMYTSLNLKDSVPITEAFEKRTGIKVEIWRAASEKVLQRGVTEARAGRYSPDIFETNGPEMEALYREQPARRVLQPALQGPARGGLPEAPPLRRRPLQLLHHRLQHRTS